MTTSFTNVSLRRETNQNFTWCEEHWEVNGARSLVSTYRDTVIVTNPDYDLDRILDEYIAMALDRMNGTVAIKVKNRIPDQERYCEVTSYNRSKASPYIVERTIIIIQRGDVTHDEESATVLG